MKIIKNALIWHKTLTQLMGKMGNRKQNYLIGSSIAAVAIALSLVAIMPAVQETPTQTTQLNALGHVTITVADPDGNIVAYRQADNFVIDNALNRIQALLFSNTGSAADFQWLSLCSKNTATLTARNANDACESPMALTRGDGDSGDGASSITTPLFGVGQTQNILAVTITITQTDADATFDELALFDSQADGNMFSVATFPVITTPLGTQVGLTYTITIGG